MFFYTEQKAIAELQKQCRFDGAPKTDDAVAHALRAATKFHKSTNPELHYWYGMLVHAYVTWFIRGDARKPHLEQAVAALTRALERADRLPWIDDAAPLDQVRIRGNLGRILVEEALVRDSAAAVTILEAIYRTISAYEPSMCFYAEALYQLGDYLQAAQVGVDLHTRAQGDPLFHDDIPTRPLDVAAKSYRALYRAAKKAGNSSLAAQHLQSIVQLGVATEHDQKLLGKVLKAL